MTSPLSPRRLATSALALTAALVLVGCGGSATMQSTTTSDTQTSAPATTSGTQTSAPATTSADLPDGDVYRDPAGEYQMSVSTEWTEGTSSPKIWYTNPEDTDFKTNINVLTQKVPAGVTNAQALESSAEQLATLTDATVLSQELITGANGQELIRIRYDASFSERELSFLVIGAVNDGVFGFATLTAKRGVLDGRLAEIEPFMRTLVVKPGA